MKSSKRRIFTALALIALAIMLCFALFACDNKTNTPGQNGGQNGDENTQVSVSTIDDLGEILAALGDSYSISEKVLAIAQRKYGSALAVLKSENADGTGELLVGTDEDGTLNVSAVSLALSADDFSARVFKSGTFTKTGDKISYYQGDKKQEEDISGAFTKTAANGDLTVIDTTKADQKISAVFDNVTLEESGLNTEITNTDKEIFALVVGNAISADKEVFLPSLSLTYDSEANKTLVKAICYNGDKISVYTVSFEGNITADGFDKDEAQSQIYKETATVATNDKDYTEYDGYSTIYCKTFASMTVEKVPSAQDLEEVITFNSWEEVFNVFGEQNSYLIENKLNEIFIEKLFNEENLKSLFGNDMTLDDLHNGKIEILKWAFTLTDNEISSVQVLAQRNGYQTEKDKRVKSAKFDLQNYLSLDNIIGKKYAKEEIDDYELFYVDTHLDFSGFANKLELKNFNQINTFLYTPIQIEETMTDEEKAEQQEKLDIFNLLMPYAVSEKTTYSHVSVSYRSGMNSMDFTIYALNESTLNYERWSFSFKEDSSAENIIELIKNGIKENTFDFYEIERKQMLSGDIIFSLDNDDIVYYEISPTAQQ